MSVSCPVCHKPAETKTTPFCSVRCREVDLNRWFTGGYAVPAVELDDVDMEALEQAINPQESDDS